MNLITAIGRILENEGIIRGDTDTPTSLTDLQHGATIRIARNSIQDELIELVSDTLIPSERESAGILSAVAGTRSYTLPTAFVRFFGKGLLRDSTNNNPIYEYPGGEEKLQTVYWDYKTAQSEPIYWYFDATTTKKIALWPVPSVTKNYTYDYEKDVSVTAATDTLPFHNEIEAQAFCRMAGRRFKMRYEGLDQAAQAMDPERLAAKTVLINLMKGENPPGQYAPTYR